MAQRYVIKRGDTLGKIAKSFYNDAALSEKLARYNGIHDPNLISLDQTLEIPSRRELNGGSGAPPGQVPGLSPPNGLDEILKTFGDIRDYINEEGTLDPGWEATFLGRAPLPFAIPFSVDRSRVISRLYCHVKLRDVFPAVFAEIQSSDLQSQVLSCGGCFNFRGKRTSSKLSTHCWGIAIDLNPETNAQGTAGNMNDDIVEIFRSAGFKWGGDWTGKDKDPMHFQYCTGY